MTAEFEFTLNMQSGIFHRSISLGYDPTATDGYDAGFGETKNYPPLGFKDFIFVNNDPSFGDGVTEVDIRHKPTLDSFAIHYEWKLASDELPVTVSWNPLSIPAKIHHVYFAPSGDQSLILGDLKKFTSFTITRSDSMLYYQDCALTLLYNEEVDAVSPVTNPTELLSALQGYPNPFHNRSTINFTLANDAALDLVVYDESGRIVKSSQLRGTSGANRIDLAGLPSKGKALFVRVQAHTARGSQIQTLTLIGQ
jgi:hypothetical protein